jgi:hypothetical protein
VCPVVTLGHQRSLCVAALVAARLVQPRCTIVATGVDTLELHTKSPVGPYIGAQLEAAFDAAQRRREPEPVEVGGVQFTVRPRLVRGAWLLENAGRDVVLRVVPDADAGEACAWVELHAAALWALGWREAGNLGERLLAAVAGVTPAEVDAQVTRVDVCADFQGWAPGPEDGPRFISRAKKRWKYREGHVEPAWDSDAWAAAERRRVTRLAKQLEAARSPEDVRRLLEVLHQPPTERVTVAEYEAGRLAFTGFAFGMGHHLGARLYNKSREIRVSRKAWFHEVWGAAEGYRRPPPDGTTGAGMRAWFDVWRLEFQLRREALRELLIDDAGGWVDLSAWRTCAQHLGDVWRFLALKWLRHGWRSADSREVLSEPWKVLRRARFTDAAPVQLERVIPECGVEPVLAALAGYATTAVAQALELPQDLEPAGEVPALDASGQATQVLLAAFARLEARAEAPAELVQAKREKLRERKAFLSRRRPTTAERLKARAETRQRYGRHDGGPLVLWEKQDDAAEARAKVRAAEAENERLREAAASCPF